MATLKTVKNRCKELGCTITVESCLCAVCDERMKEIDVIAPRGMIFAGLYCHRSCVSWYVGDKADEANAISALIADMKLGLTPCTIPDCDDCNPDDDTE